MAFVIPKKTKKQQSAFSEDICNRGRNWQLFNLNQDQELVKVCNETRWKPNYKTNKGCFFPHSHLCMSSSFSTKTSLDLWVWGEHLQKQSLNLFFQDLDTSVKYQNNRKGERLENLIWFTCAGQGDYSLFSNTSHHIATTKCLTNYGNAQITKMLWPVV